LQSGDKWKIQSAFRMGCNFQIQGTAADMTKLASIKLQPLLKELDAHIVLFVHDELIFDVPENIGMDNLQRIANVMCNALPLDCGMKSDIEVGKKWGQKMSKEELEELFNESEGY
jgi:DNA polymerase-1